MIQRIQSLFLLVAAVACILMFVIPLGSYTIQLNTELFTDKPVVKFDVRGLHHNSADLQLPFNKNVFILPFVLNIIVMALSFWSFYSFKERIFQMKLIRFAVIANIILIGTIFYFTSFIFEKHFKIPTEYNVIGICLPLLSMVMLMMAYRAISKDDKLVKSADRLR